MGNLIGYQLSNAYNLYFQPDITPDPTEEPSYDSSFGFKGQRSARQMVATEEQIYSAKLPLVDRDFCAHILLNFRACRRDVWPWVVKCKHEKHEYLKCRYEDYVIRMKEYERERRLRAKYGKFEKKTDEDAKPEESKVQEKKER